MTAQPSAALESSPSMRISRVAVVGGGTMGNGIAHVFAASGFEVALVEIQQDRLQRALATISKNLDRAVKKGTLAEADRGGVLERIRGTLDLGEAARSSDLVVEAVIEDAKVKKEVFRTLDAQAPPDAVLATNTSSISITEIGAATGRPDRVIGMHFMNPVPVMQLVEVIRGLATGDATFALIEDLVRRLGKVPVGVSDYPGFVSNRVLMPMINEAVYCLMEGVASRETIDTVMKLGMNHPLGPLALADLIGLDVCLSILEVLQQGYGDPKYRPCPLLRKMVLAGHLGRKSGRGFYEYAT